jgi:hypothetical protein
VAAFLLFLLAVGGFVVVADLVRENPAVGEITLFQQPVTGYPVGWLLAMAAALGFAIAMLLVASTNLTRRRANRRQVRRPRGLGHRGGEPDPDHDRLLDEFFGPEELPRRPTGPARPAHLGDDRREGQAGQGQRWDASDRMQYHSEPLYEQARRAALLRAGRDLPFPVRHGRRG